MNQQQHTKSFGLKVLGIMAISIGTIASGELPANALPYRDLYSGHRHHHRVRSRVVPPRPLNITPPPGRHTPLPRSNRSRDYYSEYDRHHRRSRRRVRKHRNSVIIINPSRRNTLPRYQHIRVIR